MIVIFGCFFMLDKEISSIVVQKKNPNRVSIYLDGEYAFGLSSIVAAWLRVGQKIDEAKINQLKQQDGVEVGFQYSLNLLNFKARTKQEISQKLTEKGYSEPQIEQITQKLTDSGLVEDMRYAQSWVENRNEFHPRSQRLMRLEMKRKGIEEETIEKALESSAEDSELAIRAAKQQLRKYEHLDWPEFRQKLGAFLMRRGFSYGTIAPVLRSLWESARGNSN
jgi:regulatory protein